MNNGIQVVVFDCDGVLFDSVKANTAYYNRILNRFGRPPMNDAETVQAQMQTADEVIAMLFSDPRAFKAAQDFRAEMGYEPFIELMEMAPDLKPVLSRLRKRFRTAIATNRADTMARVLSVFELSADFDLVVTSLDVERPKPHPDELLKVLDHFGVGPETALYVGDSPIDQEAARAAGMIFVAFANPALDADHHITRMDQLEPILDA